MYQRGALAAALGLLVMSASELGLAQQRDPAAAETLFRQGREALQRGDFQTACPKLAESQRLDPAAGTLMNLATCEESIGRLASAWQHWREAIDQLPPEDDRIAFATERVRALEPRLSYLTIRLASGSPSGASIVRDDIVLGAASLGIALPVDSGQHTVTVRAAGYADKSVRVAIAEGERQEVEVEAGALLPPPPKVTRRPEPPESGPPVLGYTLAGVGVLGVATAVVTGLMLPSRQDTVDGECDNRRCTEAGLDAAREGRTLLVVNTVGWITGVLGLGAGAYLILTHDGPERPSAALGVTPSLDGAKLEYTRSF